jgi:hypothetical protein
MIAAADLPPRVAQVTHAPLEALTQAGGGPLTAAEVMIYDENGLTVQTPRARARRCLADRAALRM